MMRKSLASLTSLLIVTSSLLAATPALAASTVTYSPASGGSLDVNDTIGSDLDATAQEVGTYDVLFEQTWDNSSVVPTAVDAPLGWDVEYLVDGTWQNSAPSDLLTTSGVRSAGVLEADSISNGNQQLTEEEVAGDVTPGVASIASAGRGDGWDVILTPDFIVNVFHHGSAYKLECHHLDSGELCEPDLANLYTVSGYLTSNGSGGAYYSGKVYSYVVRDSDHQTGVICTNVASLPFTSCGFVPTGSSGTTSATNSLGTQATVGTKIWAADVQQGKILCYDMATNTECTHITVAGLSGANSIRAALVNIDGLLYMVANKTYCFDPSDGSTCGGNWPVADSSYSNVIPLRSYDSGTQTYTLDGVCAFWRSTGPACWDLAGATLAVPAGLNTILTTTATEPAGGHLYFQTTAWTDSRVFWTSNATSADWAANYLTCYDYATDALCANFVTPEVTSKAYATIIDSTGSCVWSNGDSGIIGSNNALTGEAGCLPPGAIAEFTFDAVPSCTATGAVIALTSLELTLPAGVNVTDLTLKAFDSNGVFAGFNGIALTSTTIDLSSVDTTNSDGIIHFQIKSDVDTVEELELVTAAMTYVAEPLSMCVTLVVVPSCPADLSTLDGMETFSQPSVEVSSKVSMTKNGVATDITEASTYTVSDYATEGCWQWESLLGDVGGIQGTANKATVVDFLWAPDGTMYVGGKFVDAGGDLAADNLAAWDGTRWSAVAPIDENTSAINERVSSLALSPDGRTLYVGGSFTDVGGDADLDNLAVLNLGADEWSGLATPYNFATVHDIAVDPETGEVFVGGDFANYLVQVNFSGDSVTPVGGAGAVGANVWVLEFGPDGLLYSGGAFTNAGAVADADYAAVWDGSAWGAINDTYAADSNIAAAVTAFAWGDEVLYVGGLFNFVAKYASADEQWSSLAGLGGQTRSLAVSPDGVLYAAGNSSYSPAVYFARYVNSTWTALPIYNYSTQQKVNAAATAASYNYSSWTGAWNVDFSPTGNLWYGGDFTSINGNTDYAYLAHWGSEWTFGGYAIKQKVQPGYTGPVVTSVSKRSPVMNNRVTLFGLRLSGVTAVSVAGHSAKIVSVHDDRVEIIFPADMEPGYYDAVLTSGYGTLKVQDAFYFEAAEPLVLDAFKMWTSINENQDTVRIYAKDVIGLGKVQFFVDGKEIAWVRAVDTSDPKLLEAKGWHYLVRTIKLHEGKNRFEIKVDGVRVWRTTYVPHNTSSPQ